MPLKTVTGMSNFNPRSREGSDEQNYKPWFFQIWISIRAPARGATALLRMNDNDIMISIRAPARGATTLIMYLQKRT